MVNYENWERYISDLEKLEGLIEDMIVAHEEVMSDRVYHALDDALIAVQAELDVAKDSKNNSLD